MTFAEPGREDLAKYPFISEAGENVRRQGLTLDDLASPEYSNVVARARAHVLQAIQKGKISVEVTAPEIEILSFPLALMLVKASGLEHLAKRYALSEAMRIEYHLERERSEIVKEIFERVLNIQLSETQSTGRHLAHEFKINYHEYLKRSTSFRESEWKLVNRVMLSGWVHLKREDLVRLIREEIRRIILERLKAITVPRLPENLKKVVKEITDLAPPPPRPWINYPSSREGYPPCVQHALTIQEKGENLPHYPRFLLATYLLNIGSTVDDVVGLFPRSPDFNERTTRYQVEHLAGLKGGKVKYTCPSCTTLQAHNFCFKTVACTNIKNPLQFGRKTNSRPVTSVGTEGKKSGRNNKVGS